MIKKYLLATVLFLSFAAISGNFSAVSAASLQFDPKSVSSAVDKTFDVKVNVDVGSEQILGVDALIRYDSDLLEVVSITDGTFLKIGKKETGTPHKIYLIGVVEDPGTAQTGAGTMATITFKAKVESTSELQFECELGETNESNISKNDIDATDIIICSDNGKSTIVIGSGGSTVDSGSSKTPSTLPRSGAFENLALFGIIGALLLVFGGGMGYLKTRI